MDVYTPLITERLELNRLEMKDKDDFFEYRSLPAVYKYQTFKPKVIEDVMEFINGIENNPNIPSSWFQLGILLRSGHKLIGDIGIHFLDDAQAEIGFTLSPVYQSKGYAIEAVTAVFNFIFFDLLKHRVIASVDPDNLKSIKLLEALGMRKEAHFVESFRMEDKWCDELIYSILDYEWKARER